MFRREIILVRRSIALLAIAFILFAADGWADSFSRNVRSGQQTRITDFRSWDRDCKSQAATIKMVAKPSHGVVIPHIISSTIQSARFGDSGTCIGRPIHALQVDYKSTPGYRGTDNFTWDVDLGSGRQVRDTWTVTVE
jgi:hypothetical protein